MTNVGPGAGSHAQPLDALVECPDCETVRVAAADVVIRWCADDESCGYRVRCPKCGFAFVGETTETLAQAVIGSGATIEVWSLPAEIDERPSGPALQMVDLLELHLALVEPDWFDQLTGNRT